MEQGLEEENALIQQKPQGKGEANMALTTQEWNQNSARNKQPLKIWGKKVCNKSMPPKAIVKRPLTYKMLEAKKRSNDDN